MLKWFKTPAGELVEVDRVLKEGVLAEYYPLAYLYMCAEEREWKGKPSTTQLINGTRLEYLRILTPYALDPKDQAFRIVGTKAHGKLENMTPKGSMSEIDMSEDEITGIADLLEQQPNGKWILTDYKTWGSYKVVQALGLEKRKRPAVNPDGSPILYQKSGAWGKAGDQKTEDYYVPNPDLVNIPDAELQVNRYRLVLEKAYGIPIDEMRIFIIIRDGGTVAAKSRGIEDNTYYVKVRELRPTMVEDYFRYKKQSLLIAIEGYISDMTARHPNCIDEDLDGPDMDLLIEHCPLPCNEEENWYGRRCEGYCPVAEICQKIRKEQEDNHETTLPEM